MTPKTCQFSDALVRLSKQGVGLQEATVLFLVAIDQNTNEAIHVITGAAKNHIHSRTTILRTKGLLDKGYTPAGRLYHRLTKRGAKLVKDVIKEEP